MVDAMQKVGNVSGLVAASQSQGPWIPYAETDLAMNHVEFLMKRRVEMKSRALLLAVLGCVLLWTISTAAAPGPKDKTLKTGKKGEITLTQATKVGDLTLQPGTYVVQHRVSGDHHFVRFIELKTLTALDVSPETMGWYTYTAENNAGEIKCRVEPAGKSIEATTVTVAGDGGPKITRVAIKGESVVHVL
jgi:hypothetical protein